MTDANFIIVFFVTKGLIRGPKTKKTAKTQLDANLACPKIPGMCIFWEQKAPAGDARKVVACDENPKIRPCPGQNVHAQAEITMPRPKC